MKKPFTLVEVLIAMSVLSVFLLGLMQFYSSTETVMSSGVGRTDMFERARIAMDMMANDLTCVYYSQTDDDLKPFNGQGSFFEVCTVRPEKLNKNAKTNIVGVKYEWDSSKCLLNYSYDPSGDTFDIADAGFGTKSELIDGVTNFSVRCTYGENCTNLPAIVLIRMELVDKKTMKRIEANPAAKAEILKNAHKREFRRTVVIDRGQPKPKL